MLEAMRSIEDLKLVIIDTLAATLHGDENGSNIVSEYLAAINGPVCGTLKSAAMVIHHVRKQGDEPIATLNDMRNAIRGSTAILGNVRSGVGIWPASDYKQRMKQMHIVPAPNQMYMAGVVKANNPEMYAGVKTLLRGPGGLLLDVSNKDEVRLRSDSELSAWMLHGIVAAARAGFPMCKTGANGVDARKGDLPPVLHVFGRPRITSIVDDLLGERRLVHCYGGILDAPDGPFALNSADAEKRKGAMPREDFGGLYYDPDLNAIHADPLAGVVWEI
jgi:hypothetical protein